MKTIRVKHDGKDLELNHSEAMALSRQLGQELTQSANNPPPNKRMKIILEIGPDKLSFPVFRWTAVQSTVAAALAEPGVNHYSDDASGVKARVAEDAIYSPLRAKERSSKGGVSQQEQGKSD
jgi:hypothetical protein